jgi:hypothetical protein
LQPIKIKTPSAEAYRNSEIYHQL